MMILYYRDLFMFSLVARSENINYLSPRVLIFGVGAGSHSVAQADLELVEIGLPLPPLACTARAL